MKKFLFTLGLLGLILSWGTPAFSQGVFTGLVVDARESSFIPSAAPKILDEDGREVFGSAYVDKEWTEKQGIVSYAKTLEEARDNPRVAGSPLLIKAIQATGPNNQSLVISGDDARKIRDLAKNLSFLEKAKVVIVVP
jgi:hypothetical protein